MCQSAIQWIVFYEMFRIFTQTNRDLSTFNNLTMILEERILRRLDSLDGARRTHEIVKYMPEGYDDNGVYCRDEWTDFSDIGKTFDGVIFTMEEYLEIENRYIECAVDIMDASQCTFLTIGYVHDYNNKGYRYKDRVRREQLRDVLRDILRNEVWCVLVNLKHNVQINFGWDYYMNVICPLEENCLQKIVESHNLYLNPRSKRILKIVE